MRMISCCSTPRRPDRELAWVKQLMERLGLQLHPEKTRVVDASREGINFLGHEDAVEAWEDVPGHLSQNCRRESGTR